MSQLDELRTLLARHHQGVLATIRANGRPQMSNIAYGWDGDHDLVRISDLVSIDCGAILDGWHGDSAWTYGVGELSRDDEELSEATRLSLVAGIAAMVEGERQCVRLHIEHLYGQP